MDHATSFNKAHGVVQPCDYFFANMVHLEIRFPIVFVCHLQKDNGFVPKMDVLHVSLFLQYMAAPQGHLLEGCHCCGALFVWSIIQFVCFSLPGDSVLCWQMRWSALP
ncbi:unnamed protein product [Urochloa humidicola]